MPLICFVWRLVTVKVHDRSGLPKRGPGTKGEWIAKTSAFGPDDLIMELNSSFGARCDYQSRSKNVRLRSGSRDDLIIHR